MKTPESCAMYSYLLTVWNNCKPDAAPGWTRENCLVWYSRERGSVACSGWRCHTGSSSH